VTFSAKHDSTVDQIVQSTHGSETPQQLPIPEFGGRRKLL